MAFAVADAVFVYGQDEDAKAPLLFDMHSAWLKPSPDTRQTRAGFGGRGLGAGMVSAQIASSDLRPDVI
jgi:hypothetical protein